MSLLYLEEQGATVGIEANRIKIVAADFTRSVPLEAVEGITVLGHIQLTTPCIEMCLKKGIPVSFFSKGGKYFGRLQSTGHVNVERQRQQCKLYDSVFSVELAKQILRGKIYNQRILLSRYARSKKVDVEKNLIEMKNYISKIENCPTVLSIMGYEGQSAKEYFDGLSRVIEPDFTFHGRNRRPPKDPFNSLISLGYSILMNEIYVKLEERGLNPYFGFIHRDQEKHPTLASDLMEEWRPVIVDSLAMSLLNGHEMTKEHFQWDYDNPGCFLTHDGMKIFLNKFEKKLRTEVQYLPGSALSFRRARTHQVNLLIQAVETEDAKLYEPICIR